jgi:hypothetical protein
MTNHVNAAAGCLLVGEYVDEGECPTNLTFRRSEVVRPQVVADYRDLWGKHGTLETCRHSPSGRSRMDIHDHPQTPLGRPRRRQDQ